MPSPLLLRLLPFGTDSPRRSRESVSMAYKISVENAVRLFVVQGTKVNWLCLKYRKIVLNFLAGTIACCHGTLVGLFGAKVCQVRLPLSLKYNDHRLRIVHLVYRRSDCGDAGSAVPLHLFCAGGCRRLLRLLAKFLVGVVDALWYCAVLNPCSCQSCISDCAPAVISAAR